MRGRYEKRGVRRRRDPRVEYHLAIAADCRVNRHSSSDNGLAIGRENSAVGSRLAAVEHRAGSGIAFRNPCYGEVSAEMIAYPSDDVCEPSAFIVTSEETSDPGARHLRSMVNSHVGQGQALAGGEWFVSHWSGIPLYRPPTSRPDAGTIIRSGLFKLPKGGGNARM